jgi:glycosyltransferase involved in cell wall biosynthesis
MPAPRLLGLFGATAVVYDCMDELANFRFAPSDIAERERFLLENADVVFTGGYRLFETKSRYHPNTHFFGCGVDVEHYSRARMAETQLPPEVAHLPHPIFGYFGVIDERIDYDLIARLADAFPQGSIVLVGPFAKIDANALPNRPNISWLGQRAYEELPALVKAFDVCLMPFAMNEATQYINPTKTLEYMAAGKPIVSTAVPDVVRQFTPIVAVGQSIDEFIKLAGLAATAPDPALIQAGIDRAEAASWESIVAAMRGHILDAYERRRRERESPLAPIAPYLDRTSAKAGASL